jgi:hypothetical protein
MMSYSSLTLILIVVLILVLFLAIKFIINFWEFVFKKARYKMQTKSYNHYFIILFILFTLVAIASYIMAFR